MKEVNLLIFSPNHALDFILNIDDSVELPKSSCFGDMFLLDRVIGRAIPRFSFTENPENKVVTLTLPCFVTIQFGDGTPNDYGNVSFIESFLKEIADDMCTTGVVPIYVLNVPDLDCVFNHKD